MRSKLNIRAYTLIEMVIVMIISAIIVSMTYVVFTRVSSISLYLKGLYRSNYEVLLLDHLIFQDIEMANKVIQTSNGFKCVYDQETREYYIGEVIIRSQAQQVDTFDVINPISIDYRYTRNKERLITSVFLEGLYEEEALRFYYTKEYSAYILVNGDE